MAANNWQFWLALGVSILFLLFLVFQVDLGEIWTSLLQANYLYVPPAIGVYFVAVYFRSVRWKFLLSPMRKFSVGRLYPVVIIGYTANNLLPARLGELVRSYYLARRERFSTSSALATVAVERVYDGVTLLAFAALTAPILLALGQFDETIDASRTKWIIMAALTGALFAAALVFLTSLVVIPRFVDFVLWCTGVIPSGFRPRVQNLVLTFVQGLKILNSPRQHLGLFLLSVPVWLLEGASYLLIGYSFGVDQLFASLWVFVLVVVLLTATSNLATSLPTAIGGIGPFEVVAQQTLVALGVGATVATAYALVVHIVALWLPVTLVGLALAWKQNLSLPQLVQPPAPPEPGPPSGYLGVVPQGNITQVKEDLP